MWIWLHNRLGSINNGFFTQVSPHCMLCIPEKQYPKLLWLVFTWLWTIIQQNFPVIVKSISFKPNQRYKTQSTTKIRYTEPWCPCQNIVHILSMNIDPLQIVYFMLKKLTRSHKGYSVRSLNQYPFFVSKYDTESLL